VAIPDFQTLMRPLLQLHGDGGEKTQPELRHALSAEFELSEDELVERIPSGTVILSMAKAPRSLPLVGMSEA
jgi:restriction system protein